MAQANQPLGQFVAEKNTIVFCSLTGQKTQIVKFYSSLSARIAARLLNVITQDSLNKDAEND
jgi:uncharacterized protein YfaP (DUF2135 family)